MLCCTSRFMGNRIFMNTFSAMSWTILRLFSAATLKGISALQCSISVDWVSLWSVLLHFINKNRIDITLLSLLTSQTVMNFLFDEKLWGSLFLLDVFITQLCIWLSWPDMLSCFHVYLPPQPLCLCVGCLDSNFENADPEPTSWLPWKEQSNGLSFSAPDRCITLIIWTGSDVP